MNPAMHSLLFRVQYFEEYSMRKYIYITRNHCIAAGQNETKWADENMYNEKMNGNGKQTIDLTSFGFIHIEHNV